MHISSNGPAIAYDFICKVKEEIKTKNRSSCDSRIDELIKRYADEAGNTWNMPAQRTLFRARIYKKDNAEHRYKHPPKGPFKGYDASNSFVNRNSEKIPEGRCNPQYIPYLYTSCSKGCCIYEIRPTKGAYVSVAQIRVLENLKVLNFSLSSFMADTLPQIVDGASNSTLFTYLAFEFSRPHENEGDYLLCQYVSEKVKVLGFDGVSFFSSVYPNSAEAEEIAKTNITIFNFEKCKPSSSRLCHIDNLQLTYSWACTPRSMTNNWVK